MKLKKKKIEFLSKFKNILSSQEVVVKAFSPNTREEEANGSLLVRSQPALQSEVQERQSYYRNKSCPQNKTKQNEVEQTKTIV